MAKKLSQAEIDEEIRRSSLYIGYDSAGQRYDNLVARNGFHDPYDAEPSERVSTRYRGPVNRREESEAYRIDAETAHRRRSAKDMYKSFLRSEKKSARKMSNKVR